MGGSHERRWRRCKRAGSRRRGPRTGTDRTTGERAAAAASPWGKRRRSDRKHVRYKRRCCWRTIHRAGDVCAGGGGGRRRGRDNSDRFPAASVCCSRRERNGGGRTNIRLIVVVHIGPVLHDELALA